MDKLADAAESLLRATRELESALDERADLFAKYEAATKRVANAADARFAALRHLEAAAELDVEAP